MNKHAPAVILLIAALTLSACGQPVPQDKSAYVGEWRAQAMVVDGVELTRVE